MVEEVRVEGEALAPYQCLISYSHADQPLVHRIVQDLRRLGIECWIDEDEMLAGRSWKDYIPRAFAESASVAIFFGPTGSGESQLREWQYLVQQCEATGKHYVPVALPGGGIPDDLDLSRKLMIPVASDDGDDINDAVERLAVAIDPTRRTRENREYVLIVDLDTNGPNCCIAVPRDGDRTLFGALKLAAHHADLPVVQSSVFDDEDTYNPDLKKAVAGTSILIADCTLNPATGLPDPDVTYQMGLARAMCKPVVIITNQPLSNPAFFRTDFDRVVEYTEELLQEDEPNALNTFIEGVRTEIEGCLDQQREPYLVEQRYEGVSVARADVFCMRSTFWGIFPSIQLFGLRIRDVFGHVAPAVYNLLRTAEVLDEDTMTAGLQSHTRRDLEQFRRAHEEFQSVHQTHAAPLINRPDENGQSVAHAFEKLYERTKNDSRRLVEEAQANFKVLERKLETYGQCAEMLFSIPELTESFDHSPITIVKMQVQTLADLINTIELQAYQMSTCLLDLISQNASPPHKE